MPVEPGGLRSFIRDVYSRGAVVGEAGAEHPLSPHGLPERDGEALRDLAISEGAVHTVETGMRLGLSTLFLAEAILSSGRVDARHVAIDPSQEIWDGAGLRTVREARLEGLVEFVGHGAELALPRLLSDGDLFDLAFVDGDHRFEGAFIDLYYLHQLVKPGGLIVVDDVWLPAVRLAVAHFVTNFGLIPEPVAPAGRAFTAEPRRWRHEVKAPPKARMAVLRRPSVMPKRTWDHFVPFADRETGRAPALAAAARAAKPRLSTLLHRAGHAATRPSGEAMPGDAVRQGTTA